MKGYAGREDDARLREGWRATGDLGWVDQEGYAFFAGRKDDMIIRGGENIAPAEVETVLMSHPAVEEAAVIGVPSVEWGQTVKAYVVKRSAQGGRARHHRVLPHPAGELQTSRNVDFLEALPKNPLGKILRKELRERPTRQQPSARARRAPRRPGSKSRAAADASPRHSLTGPSPALRITGLMRRDGPVAYRAGGAGRRRRLGSDARDPRGRSARSHFVPASTMT